MKIKIKPSLFFIEMKSVGEPILSINYGQGFLRFRILKILFMIKEKRCIECDRIKPMYHNAWRYYECSIKHRKEMDRLRFEKRKSK